VASWFEEFGDGDGFVATRAGPSVADSGHEGVAVVAALLSEGTSAAGGAFVDGDRSAWLGGGQDDGGLGVVSSPVGDGFAGVGAEASASVRGECFAADGAGDRDVIVTRRGLGRHGLVPAMPRRVASARARWDRIR